MAQMAQTIFIFNDKKKPRLYCIHIGKTLARPSTINKWVCTIAQPNAQVFLFIIIIVGPSERNETVKPAVTLETAVPNGLYLYT